MPVSPDVLFSPRLKVERAKRHIDELRHLSTPLAPDLYSLQVEPLIGYPRGAMAQTVVYRPLKPIPEIFALIIGDAVHNLRSALDHLATGIARSEDARAEIHFPMRKDRKDLVAPDDKRLRKTLEAIESALPGATKLLLENIRVEGGPNESLWAFHALDNDDKHNLLVPTVAFAEVVAPRILIGTNTDMPGGITGNDATREFHLYTSIGAPISVVGEFQTTVEVKFGKGGPFEDDPVIPTLTQISEVVSKAIDAFEELIRES